MGHGTPWDHWYGLRLWRRRSLAQRCAYPLCAMCLAKGKAVAATCADHITPHRGDWTKFTRGALQSLCTECHNGVKQLEDRPEGWTSFDQIDRQRGFRTEVGADGWPLDPKHPVYDKGRRKPFGTKIQNDLANATKPNSAEGNSFHGFGPKAEPLARPPMRDHG
jgi:5-methylcytosine-specific restriction enzyme A